MTQPVLLSRLGVLSCVLAALCSCGGRAVTRPSASLSGEAPFKSLVIQCVPEDLPAAFIAERGRQQETARTLFQETRSTVMTTLGLYLGTGRWAGDRVRIQPNLESPLPGTDEECQALRRVVGGGTVAPLPSSPDWVMGRTAVTAIVSYGYVPARIEEQTIPPRLEVLLAVVLLRDGKVVGAAPATTTADYARVSLGYQERTSQEVAQTLTEHLAGSLKKAMTRVLP